MIRPESFSMQWPVKSLGSVVEFLDHKRVPITASDRKAGPYPYYGANGQQDSVDGYLFDEPLLLLAEDGGNFSDPSRDIAYIARGKYWVNNHAHVIKPTSVVDLEYLWRVMARYDVTPYIKGATRAKLSKTDASRIPIPLPPLATQKHIARVLEQADQLRKQAQQMESELNQLAQSLFLEMFGKYFYDKSLFESCSEEIANLVTIIDYRGKTPEKTDSGIPLITAKNVKQGYINPEPREFIAEETYGTWMSRGYPEEHDVLFTTEAPLGNVTKLGRYEKVVIGQRLLDLRCGKKLKPDYLVFALQNELIQQAILARSTGSTVKGIRSKVFERISIPVPPIELQIKFSEFMAQIEKVSTEHSEKSIRIENLFESAMQRAFNGEVTTPERKAA